MLDKILNHNSGEIIYFAFQKGASVEELAEIYLTTPAVIRVMLRRHRKKLIQKQVGPARDPA